MFRKEMANKFKEDNLYFDSCFSKEAGGKGNDKETLMKREKFSFLLCWLTSVWKRIWRCTYLYCDHNNQDITSSAFLKCLKYNLLAPTGILERTKIFLDKALQQGFLMPTDYEEDSNKKFLGKTIYLFTESYKIAEIEDKYQREAAITKFINNSTMGMLADYKLIRSENSDILRDCGIEIDNIEKRGDKHCLFCELVDSWDIDPNLFPPQDEVSEMVRAAILKFFEMAIFN